MQTYIYTPIHYFLSVPNTIQLTQLLRSDYVQNPYTYLSTHTVYQYKIHFFSLFGGDMAILENGYRKT